MMNRFAVNTAARPVGCINFYLPQRRMIMERKVLGFIALTVLCSICFGLPAGIAADKVYINGFDACIHGRMWGDG
jgi:hypothetical protein